MARLWRTKIRRKVSMPTYKTEGFILKKKALGEADRLYSIFTQDHGKIEAIADGTAKISSKLAGSLEPFTINRLMIADGRYFERIAGAQIANNYLALKTDLFNWSLLWIISEGLNYLTVSHLTEPQIYQLLKNLLNKLTDNEEREQKFFLILQFFWLNFRIIGQRPRIDQQNFSNKIIFFNKIKGTFFEQSINQDENNFPKGYLVILPELIDLLVKIENHFQKYSDLIYSFSSHQLILKNFYQLVIAYYHIITNRQFNSFKFLVYV